jgi:hypothetical protein
MSGGSRLCAWSTRARANVIVTLKRAKRELDPVLIGRVADSVATLILQLYGGWSADAITTVTCGQSRRPDCFGKQLAQAVGRSLGLPFLQVFADRPCSGVSHPKEFVDWGNRDMRIGIVGSRRRTDRGTVEVCQRLGYVPAKIGSAFHSWDRTRAPTFIRRREPRSASQCEGRNQVEAEGCSAAIWIGSQRRSGWESGIAVLA